jgi:4-oxalocrotonate tautomerase
MPYVNIKVVKQQVDLVQKNSLIAGLMDILVKIMDRDPDLTVITIDEIDQSNWIIAGKPIDSFKHNKVCCIEIKISKGTSSSEQITDVIKAGKELIMAALGSNDITNYFIINELNPDSWGFDGISMTIRNQIEQNK